MGKAENSNTAKEKKPIFKKWWFWAIIVVVIIGVVGSAGGNSNDDKGVDTPGQEQNMSDSQTGSIDENAKGEEKNDISEDSEKEDASNQDVPKNVGDLGDYHVEIKSAVLAEDYEGNPAIVVTYAWTNNSDDTKSSLSCVIAKAFQDGVELESAIIMNDDVFDSSSYTKEVRPGTTIDIQNAFVLTSETSIVGVEISELISFSDKCVAMDFDPATL